jgi:hypothetical protein
MRQLIGANGWSPIVFSVPGVANVAGGGDGDAVTITSLSAYFTDAYGTGLLPPVYSVQVTPNQACSASVTNKTSSGFDVVLTPASGVTLAAGTFDVLVFGT